MEGVWWDKATPHTLFYFSSSSRHFWDISSWAPYEVSLRNHD